MTVLKPFVKSIQMYFLRIKEIIPLPCSHCSKLLFHLLLVQRKAIKTAVNLFRFKTLTDARTLTTDITGLYKRATFVADWWNKPLGMFKFKCLFKFTKFLCKHSSLPWNLFSSSFMAVYNPVCKNNYIIIVHNWLKIGNH